MFTLAAPVSAVAGSEECIEFAGACVTRDDSSVNFYADGEAFDWSPLAQMPWLETVVIEGDGGDLPPLDLALLAEHDKLTELTVINVPLTNAEVLASVPLNGLSLENTGIAEFTFLEALSDLRWLKLQNVKGFERVDQIPKATLSQLTDLHLEGEELKDLQGLSQARALGTLSIKPGTYDLSGVGPLPGLERLTVSSSGLRSLDGFVPGPGLRYVSALRSSLEDISALAHAPNLEKLSISGTQVSDISVLAAAENLKTLSAMNSQIYDLSPLEGNVSIENLSLNGTRVRDVAPLAGCRALITLNLTRTKVDDFTPLLPLVGHLRLTVEGRKVLEGSELIQFIEESGDPAE